MGVKKCHCCHIRSDHTFDIPVCLLHRCCQQHDTRQEYTLWWWFTGMRIKCPALMKNNFLTNQVAAARRSSVLTWPCMRVLVVEPEIDWHASMRAMESLAIPFEQPAQSDWAIHRGKHRFLKPAYANCINRLNPSQVGMQGKEQIKKQSKRRKKERKRFCLEEETAKALHRAVILQTWP